MHSLPLFLRLKDRPVILLGSGAAAEAKRRLLAHAGARIVEEDANSPLAIVALEDETEAQAAVERLKARGILVNATDRPALCDFTLPAILDRDPVLIAIGTGGASAGLAKALRQRLEALLPASLGRLADALAGAREAIRARWSEPGARRRAIDAALAPGGVLDPLMEHEDGAVDLWVETANAGRAHRLESIRLTSADPEELTLRAARLLGQADCIYHQPAVPERVLRRARADAARIVADAPPHQPAPGLTLWIEAAS